MILTRPPLNALMPAVASIPQTNLQLWYKADVIGGLANLDPVGTWPDQSGNGRDATQGTGSAKPTYHTTGGSNNQPYLSFDGGDGLNIPDFMTGYTAGHLFLVVKADNDPALSGATCIGFWGHGGGGSNQNTLYPFTNGVLHDSFGASVRFDTGDPAVTLAQWNLYEVLTLSSGWTNYLNGTQNFTTGTNTVAFNTTPTLGADGSGNFFLGSGSEVIFYNAQQSGANLTAIKSYISTKYALTIA